MTKQDIIDHLTSNCGLHRSSAIRAVEGVINSITDALARGEAVTLRGFAAIKPVDRAEKIGRYMNTGKPVVIPAHRSAKLVLSKELKEKLNS
ncbi:MAG: HU family DNA-binding protein [Bacteroides sp.]|nr:HU family DNA-binding protein [Bacteroides sp.]